eukprot:TRINITY_DN1021_c0_g3_i2.p1 TRINITY_DN1021_c0_g3~~TRINITY_DN1021_c0_g3_i2.p1  ORF type:complete len:803 (-),score=174.73 TRINITY_DN1021_c0_g3_i2:150-2558(-)
MAAAAASAAATLRDASIPKSILKTGPTLLSARRLGSPPPGSLSSLSSHASSTPSAGAPDRPSGSAPVQALQDASPPVAHGPYDDDPTTAGGITPPSEDDTDPFDSQPHSPTAHHPRFKTQPPRVATDETSLSLPGVQRRHQRMASIGYRDFSRTLIPQAVDSDSEDDAPPPPPAHADADVRMASRFESIEVTDVTQLLLAGMRDENPLIQLAGELQDLCASFQPSSQKVIDVLQALSWISSLDSLIDRFCSLCSSIFSETPNRELFQATHQLINASLSLLAVVRATMTVVSKADGGGVVPVDYYEQIVATRSSVSTSFTRLQETTLRQGIGKNTDKSHHYRLPQPAQAVEKLNFYDSLQQNESDSVVYGEEVTAGSTKFYTIRAATLNRLIERLTHESIGDHAFYATFIATYRSFTTPAILLTKLIERYHVPDKTFPTEEARQAWLQKSVAPIQLRVCSRLKMWIETRWDDFDSELLARLKEFVAEIEVSQPKLGQQLTSAISKQSAPKMESACQFISDPKTWLPSAGLLYTDMILTYDVEEIAKQLTLVDFQYFSQIQPVELLNQAWTKLKHRAPNVVSIVSRFNQISAWVSSVILWESNLKERRRKISLFMDLNQELMKLNNFNGIAAVSAGLGATVVHRLKETREGLKSSALAAQADLNKLMDPDGSYKRYRATLHAIQPPCVPFLGVYLRDLTFISDGNADFLTDDCTMINFHKRTLEFSIIAEIQQYQQVNYNFPVVQPLAAMLWPPPTSSEEDLMKLTFLREERKLKPESGSRRLSRALGSGTLTKQLGKLLAERK